MAARNPEVFDEEDIDPYIYKDKLYVATCAAMINLINECEKHMSTLNTPFIVSQGKIDKVVDPNGAFDLMEKSTTPVELKQLLYYKEAWHDLIHDPVWEANVEKMI